MREGRDAYVPPPIAPVVAPAEGVLGDNLLATNLRQQAERMAAEAKGLLAESDRLLQQAAVMDPPSVTAPAKVAKAKKPAKAKVSA